MYRIHIENKEFIGWIRIVDDKMTLVSREDEGTQFRLNDAHAYIAALDQHDKSTFLLKPVPRIEHYGDVT